MMLNGGGAYLLLILSRGWGPIRVSKQSVADWHTESVIATCDVLLHRRTAGPGSGGARERRLLDGLRRLLEGRIDGSRFSSSQGPREHAPKVCRQPSQRENECTYCTKSGIDRWRQLPRALAGTLGVVQRAAQ